MLFQSTLPARGATVRSYYLPIARRISIHAPRTGSDADNLPGLQRGDISIHAPRTGSDPPRCCACWACRHFNPRSPHGERQALQPGKCSPAGFQSTLPARGATRRKTPDKNPLHISIHAPRTGSDVSYSAHSFAISIFQSTLPARGATQRARTRAFYRDISIHAPRTGSDTKRLEALEGRKKFQSTLPARGATPFFFAVRVPAIISIHAPRTGSDARSALRSCCSAKISIHAPRTGSDPCACPSYKRHPDFNPRSPHGERLLPLSANTVPAYNFNPRSPHGERQSLTSSSAGSTAFQSTLPARGATDAQSVQESADDKFQSTLPARGATLAQLFII